MKDWTAKTIKKSKKHLTEVRLSQSLEVISYAEIIKGLVTIIDL